MPSLLELIDELREQHGSINAAARAIGMPQATLHAIYTRREEPTLRTLALIARYRHVPLWKLLREMEGKERARPPSEGGRLAATPLSLAPFSPSPVSSNAVSHRVTVQGDALRFAAAHFATFEGRAEPLHGHNYAVTVHLDGDLTPDAWVFDFGRLRGLVAALCQELDHRFLLPLANSALRIAEREAEYEVAFQDRRYVMPKGDVAALPIDNSTAERLAEWLTGRLAEELRTLGAANVHAVTVGVEEAAGQAGWFSLPLSPPTPEQ